MILYGLKTCDTCRKALAALTAAGHEVELRDIREAPLTQGERAAFLSAFGDALVNRASTTWRMLSDDDREASADDLLRGHPALMKRPVIRDGSRLTLGWKIDVQALYLK
ncbi:MAG: arsenate reductase [Rhodobacteraceae bacterium]|nr:arsenate reductase [Paracoccaceae bacterium]